MSSRLSLTFKIYKGDQLVREETLTQGVIKIGKVPSAHLRIDDESVSRMHAILEVDAAGNVHVIDLGSTRGTFVNGQRISKAKLETGDAITLGDLRVEIAFKYPAEAVAPAPVVAAVPPPVPARPAPVLTPAPAAARTATAAAPAPFAARVADDEVGAKAIEVATLLGDSVVDVKHCIDPKSGKISARTWGAFAAGAACLLTSGIAFAVSVQTAAYNKGGLDYWTHVAHKPASAFRPHMLGFGFDWLAFGGLGLGLVAMIVGLRRMRDEKRTPYYRIGTAPGVEAAVEGAPTPSFPLVAPSAEGDDFVFNYGAGMDGELLLDGTSTPLAELAATGRARPSTSTAGAIELPIPARARIRARAGQTTFMVSAVTQPRRQAAPLFSLESRAAKYFAGSLAAHLGIWALLNQIPVDDGAAAIDVASHEPVAINAQGAEHELTPPPEETPTETGDASGGGKKSTMGIEGQAGTTDSAVTNNRLAIKDNHTPPAMSREEAIQQAREAGILGSTMLRSGFDPLVGTGDVTSGLDNVTAYGAVFGADPGANFGYFGMGRTGFGRNGGCTTEPCGTIASGGFGTIGDGDRAGAGYRGPGGWGHGMHRGGAVPPVVIGQATGSPDIDRATIRRYIKRNYEKIAYCYEHELLAHPSIEGSVTVQFFITPSGVVQGSSGSGFDATVAHCVAEVVGNIAFPKLAGGGVQVNYPFTFHAVGATAQ